MVDLIEYIGIPGTIAVGIIALYVAMQLIGEFVELCGKVVPEFFKIRKFFARKKQEKEDTIKTLKKGWTVIEWGQHTLQRWQHCTT